MKRILFIILFLLGSLIIKSQTDSIIMLLDGVAKYKTVRVDNSDQYFYKKDTLGNWILYFQWDEEPYERYYYKIDPNGERTLLFLDKYIGDTIYSYYYDSLGVESLSWVTKYYYQDYATSSMMRIDDNNDINLTVIDGKIIISSKLPVENLKLIGIEGRTQKKISPHKTNFYIKSFKGFYILELETERGLFYKKVVVY